MFFNIPTRNRNSVLPFNFHTVIFLSTTLHRRRLSRPYDSAEQSVLRSHRFTWNNFAVLCYLQIVPLYQDEVYLYNTASALVVRQVFERLSKNVFVKAKFILSQFFNIFSP